MSSLTVALAILGGLVLAAVIAFNTWSSRRNAPRQPDQGEDSQHAPSTPARMSHDEDGAELRIEPGLDGQSHALDRHDPQFDSDLPAPARVGPAVGGIERRGALDPLIDVIAPIALDGIVSGDAALAAMPATRRAGSKPVSIEGLNEKPGDWETPTAGQRYRAFQAGVQLANRTGALNEIEYSEFVVKASGFAEALSGTPDFPEMLS